MNNHRDAGTPSRRHPTTLLPALGAMGLALLALGGWWFDRPRLAGLDPSYIPMAPSTALAILLLAVASLAPLAVAGRPNRRRVAVTCAAVVLTMAVWVLLSALVGLFVGFEELLVPATPHRPTGVPAGRMSPYTAAMLAALAVAHLLRQWRRHAADTIAALLEGGVFFAALLLTVAYLYHTPYFYDGGQIPVALTTALAIDLLAAAATVAAGLRRPPLSLLTGTPTQNRLMAALLPVIAATLMTSLLLAFVADHADRHLALFSSAATVMVLIACSLWGIRFARRTGAVIDQVNAETLRLKNYLANIVDSMPEILVGVDSERLVTQWNRHAEAVTGITREEALGRPFAQLLPAFSPWLDTLRDDIAARRPATLEKLLVEQEGERHFFDLMLYPLTSNCVVGTVVRIDDVTERARIEEMMIQTEKMMSVGGLAAGIAHEINNPLGVITQAAQNVERRLLADLPGNREAARELGIEPEQLQRYLERRQIPQLLEAIRQGVARSARIVSGMLLFSRQSGTAPSTVKLAEILETALELAGSDYDLKKKFDFRSIAIDRDYASDLPDISVNPIEIEQVVLNLLKNAAQAMADNPPDRPPRLTLCLRREERWLVLEIADNGPGMAEEIRRRVFEPFFTTKEPGVGTGLGLSVSYTIVTHNHKGLIGVESAPGEGARFVVRLPLVAGAHEAGDREPDRTDFPAYPPREGG